MMNLRARPQVTVSTRWMFATAGLVPGVVLTAAAYYILIYYSQVLGLSASLVGTALAIALLVDAVSDPAVGFVSDNWKSRWGRRHPFLLASLIPICVFHLLLWLPPSGLSQSWLFVYLLVCIIGLRVSLTVFDVPANALVPELTSDYEERTQLFTYKGTSYWMMGSILGVGMYGIWLLPTPEYPDGIMNPQGYRDAAVAFVIVSAIALLVFVLGTRRFVPFLTTRETRSLGFREFVRQVGDVLRIPSLRTMLAAGMIGGTSAGISMALWAYVYSYFWEVTTPQLSLVYVSMTLGAIPALYLLPRMAKGKEKRGLAIWLTVINGFFYAFPVVFRLMGIFPENGTDVLFWILMAHTFIGACLSVMASGLVSSMLGDLVEQSQLKTAHRPEGVILSTATLVQKSAGALGAMCAGVILDVVEFPTGAGMGEVDASSLFGLGLFYGPAYLVLGLVAAWFLSRYRVARSDHTHALEELGLAGTVAPEKAPTVGGAS